MQNVYFSNEAYENLIADLGAAFVIAATSTGTDLRDKLTEALAVAGILPEVCSADAVLAA